MVPLSPYQGLTGRFRFPAGGLLAACWSWQSRRRGVGPGQPAGGSFVSALAVADIRGRDYSGRCAAADIRRFSRQQVRC